MNLREVREWAAMGHDYVQSPVLRIAKVLKLELCELLQCTSNQEQGTGVMK